MQDRLQELFPVHYRNGNILMINADCMEVMKHIQDKEVALAIVDPPYGIGADKGTGGDNLGIAKVYKHEWDSNSPDYNYFNELFRVSKEQIIWGVNYYNCFDLSGGRIVWDKNNSGNFSDCELAFCSFGYGIRKFKYTWNGMIQEDMKNKESRIHPTQKPVSLYKWLLTRYAKPCDRIIDTHGGSGSICIACHDLGYELTWMEKDPDYYAAAVERYKRHAAQAVLFEPEEVRQVPKDQVLFDAHL
jgi:site-specific DNA-methyltransferase (adenine-specific)